MFYNDNYLSPKQKSLVQNYIHQVLIKNISTKFYHFGQVFCWLKFYDSLYLRQRQLNFLLYGPDRV